MPKASQATELLGVPTAHEPPLRFGLPSSSASTSPLVPELLLDTFAPELLLDAFAPELLAPPLELLLVPPSGVPAWQAPVPTLQVSPTSQFWFGLRGSVRSR